MPCLSLYPEQTLNPLELSAQLPFQLLHGRPGSPIISLPTDSLPNIPFGLYPSEYDPLPGPYNTALQSRAVRHTPSPIQLSDFSTVRPIQQRHSDPPPISGQTSELVLYFFEHVKGLLKFHPSSNDITNVLYSVSLLFSFHSSISWLHSRLNLMDRPCTPLTSVSPSSGHVPHEQNSRSDDQIFSL
jgi:hypothetical protein